MTQPASLTGTAGLIAILMALSQIPPAALDDFTPDDQFSAERAMAIVEDLLAESEPHVTGSPLNRQIRERIENQFEAMGYQPEVQALFHCHPHFGSCANIENVIAVKPGSEGRNAVLVTAHYDSRWASPGAGDDGAGAASILEIARMATKLGESQNDLIFLITDAEEQGMVGAHAFAEHHPLFPKVKAVINIEARGVSGPSMMFETGDGNRSIIRVLSKSLDRPVANSLANEVYKRMSNDTDYSVYRERGVMGVNFAFSHGVALYHSRLDDVEHLDRRSVQHQGQNAWSMLQALADRDITRLASREDAAYVDIFGRVLWHYPASTASGVTVLLTVLLLLGIVIAHKRNIRPMGVIWAIIAQATVMGVLLGGAWLLNWPLGLMVETHPIEHPNPWAARIAVFSLCALSVWVGSKLFAHRISAGDALLVSWVSFAALALYLDFNLPTASFLVLLPMAAFFIGMLFDLLRWRTRNGLIIASLFGFWMATYLAVYFFYNLDSVISFNYTHLMAAPLVLMLVPVLPLWFYRFVDPIPYWRPGFVLLGLVAAAAIYHQFLPGFTQDRPRGMNLVYRQASGDELAFVYLESPGGGVDKEFADAMGLVPRQLPAGYSSSDIPLNDDQPSVSRYATDVASFNLPAPQLGEIETRGSVEASELDERSLRFSVQAPSESERLVIAFPKNAKIAQARVNGVLAIDGNAKTKRGGTATFLAVPYPGTELITVDVQFQDTLPPGFNVISRQALPSGVREDFEFTWPNDAQPIFHGFRAEVVSGNLLPQD
jgi:hypothetical protein